MTVKPTQHRCCRVLVLSLAALAWAAPAPAAVPSRGTLRVFVILAGFSDRALRHPTTDFVGPPTSLLSRLAEYVATASAGRLRLEAELGARQVVLADRRQRYVQRPDAIASEALASFVAVASAADRTRLRAATAVAVFFAGPGRESHAGGGDVDDPWSNYTQFGPAIEGFHEALVIAEEEVPPFSNFGVLCHEFGHLLGLPELYAPGAATHEGIGVWGLMGQGTWLGKGEHPPDLDAWSKVRLGWADLKVIDRPTAGVHFSVGAVDRPTSVAKIPAVPGRPEEYYLVELRQREGLDRLLPGSGLLVWHVDERVAGWRDAQANPAHKLLHLVEADGGNDLDRGHRHGGNRGERSDPWVGPPAARLLAGRALALAGILLVGLAVFRLGRARPVVGAVVRMMLAGAAIAAGRSLEQGPVCGPSTPGMAPYGGEPVRVVLRRFSSAGSTMTVDVLVAPDLAAAPPVSPAAEGELSPGAERS